MLTTVGNNPGSTLVALSRLLLMEAISLLRKVPRLREAGWVTMQRETEVVAQDTFDSGDFAPMT